MLYYSSIHPEWDQRSGFPNTLRARQISTLLDAISLNHYRNSASCFQALEQQGVILGNGGFETILLQQDPSGPLQALDPHWPETVSQTAARYLTIPLWYCFSVSGRLYVLCCFPRMREGSGEAKAMEQQLFQAFSSISSALRPTAPQLRILLSDVQFGEAGIFRSFNNLHHAMEYYDFLTERSPMIQLDSEQQLHGAFIGDMSVYRQFSVAIAQQLVQDSCDTVEIARQICDTLLENSVPSIESVHHHIQIFMLSFTDYLGSSGLVDNSYILRHNIVYRAMEFEREAEFRVKMQELVEELRRQHRILRAIGRQKRIQTIREYVELHITDPELSVSQISDHFQISTAQIAKQFRYYFGVSLHRFLQQIRFQTAQNLIEAHPDWAMAQVSQASGYTDLSTMYRAFRQLGNITPGALRDAARHSAISEPSSQPPTTGTQGTLA